MKTISVFGTLAVTGILNILSISGAWAVACGYPGAAANCACAYPGVEGCAVPADVAVCLNPTSDNQCIGNRQGVYPLVDSATKIRVEGCYNEKFQRVANLPASRNCADAAAIVANPALKTAPIRVELYYQTSCSANRTKCLNGANVNVVPVIKSDAAIGAIKMNLQDPNLQPISLKNISQTNASKSFCNSLYGNGYAYNAATKQCEISVETQCRLLGMEYDVLNNKCISDICAASLCPSSVTDSVCKGYTVNPPGQSCVCKGTATSFDSNGSSCVSCGTKATKMPFTLADAIKPWNGSSLTELGLIGYWRLKGSLTNELNGLNGGYPLKDGTQMPNFALFQGIPIHPVKFTSTDPLMGDAALFDGRSFLWVGSGSGDSGYDVIGKLSGTEVKQPSGDAARTIMGWIYTEDRHSFSSPNTSDCSQKGHSGGRQRTPFYQGRSWFESTLGLEFCMNSTVGSATNCGCNGGSASSIFGALYNWGSGAEYGGYGIPEVPVPNAGWWHVAYTWSPVSKKLNLYINGALVKSGDAGSKTLNTAKAPFMLGSSDGGANDAVNGGRTSWESSSVMKSFSGRMREIAMFNAELNQTQIQSIYDGGKNGFCEKPVSTAISAAINLVVANELPRDSTKEAVVEVKDTANFSSTYSLKGYNGELASSIDPATGNSYYNVLAPTLVKLDVDLRMLKGSQTAYVRIYNNGYDVEKGPFSVSTTAQTVTFENIPVTHLDKTLIVHVSNATIPKSDYSRARIFFARGGCAAGNFKVNLYDYDNGSILGAAPAGNSAAGLRGVYDRSGNGFDPHASSVNVRGTKHTGGTYENVVADNDGFASGNIFSEATVFTDLHKPLNHFVWADIPLTGGRSGDSARALNFTVSNTSAATCNADAFIYTNDAGYSRTSGLNMGSSVSFNNIATTNRGGYSQNAHIIVGAVAPNGGSVSPPADTPVCSISEQNLTATLTSAGTMTKSETHPTTKVVTKVTTNHAIGESFTSTGMPLQIPCGTYTFQYVNVNGFDSARSVYTTSAPSAVTPGGGVMSSANCTFACLIHSSTATPAAWTKPNGATTCTDVVLDGVSGGMTTSVLFQPTCP